MFKLELSVRNVRRVLAIAAIIALLEIWTCGQAAAASGTASRQNPVQQFRLAAESLYRSVSAGDPLVVLRKVREAEAALAVIPPDALPSPGSASALSGSMERMRRAVVALSPDEQEVYRAAAALRLAADTVSPDGQGLWLEYRRLMREEAASLGESLGSTRVKSDPDARRKLDSLAGHYGLIRAAAAASGRATAVERADAVFRYAERVLASPQAEDALLAQLPQQLRETVEGLFPPETETPASGPLHAAPPAGFFTTIGAFILTALTYSGWRKYRGEHGRRDLNKRT